MYKYVIKQQEFTWNMRVVPVDEIGVFNKAVVSHVLAPKSGKLLWRPAYYWPP